MSTSPLFPQLLSRTNHRRQHGFSLIELLVVVLIIGVLLGVGLPAYLKQRHAAQDRAAQADLTSAGKLAKAFYVENGDSFVGLEDRLPADWVPHRGEPIAVKQLHTHVVCLTTTSGSGTEWALRIVSAPVDGYDYVGEELGRADELGECGAGEDTSEAGAIILTAAVYDPNTGNLELEWEDDPEADYYEVCVEDGDCEIVYGTSWSGYTGGKRVTITPYRSGIPGSGGSYSPSTGGSGSGHTPPPPVDSGGGFTVEQVGTTVRLTFTDTGTGADSYEIRRCVTAGCTDGAAIATIPSDGPREYTYDDNVTELIENGVTLARYQVVAFKGVYGTASNWVEVSLAAEEEEDSAFILTDFEMGLVCHAGEPHFLAKWSGAKEDGEFDSVYLYLSTDPNVDIEAGSLGEFPVVLMGMVDVIGVAAPLPSEWDKPGWALVGEAPHDFNEAGEVVGVLDGGLWPDDPVWLYAIHAEYTDYTLEPDGPMNGKWVEVQRIETGQIITPTCS